MHGLWDLSLSNGPAGGLHLMVQDDLRGETRDASDAGPIPIGGWVHLQVYLTRAADSTGEFAVYQDGVLALHLQSIVTDDSQWGEWYVGNWADAIEPPESTVYVDDVAIAATL